MRLFEAVPQSVRKGSIRTTLMHIVTSQLSRLGTLMLPFEKRRHAPTLEFTEIQDSARRSGEGLLALARDKQKPSEHREQICSMLSALGLTSPDVDGWSYGEAINLLIPVSD